MTTRRANLSAVGSLRTGVLLALALLVTTTFSVGFVTTNGEAARWRPRMRPCSGGNSSPLSLERLPDLMARTQPQVVAILVRGAPGTSQGSGVIWDSRGTIDTNAHVVAAG